MNFTPKQLQVISHYQENLPLIACADSGKTDVVVRHVVNLLKNGLTPRNIVAPTSTDKATAPELKEHIVTHCHEKLGERHGMAEMYVGTIHAFCLELLKNEPQRIPGHISDSRSHQVVGRTACSAHSASMKTRKARSSATNAVRRCLCAVPPVRQ
jgi:superfamily I DNA/RNA helicase